MQIKRRSHDSLATQADGLAVVDAALGAGFVAVLLTTLQLASGSLTALALVVDGRDRAWLVLLWLCAAAAGLVAFVVARRAPHWPPWIRWCIRVSSAGGLVLVAVFMVWKDPTVLGAEFTGFGAPAAILGVIGAVLLIALIARLPLRFSGLSAITIGIAVVLGVPATINTPQTLSLDTDLQFTLQDLLAQASGQLSGFNYAGQYSNLLGLPLAILAPFHEALADRAALISAIAIGWVVLMQWATMALAVFGLWHLAPRRIRWLLPLLVLGMAWTNGVSYYAIMPLRFLLPIVLFCVICFVERRALRRPGDIRLWTLFGVGAIAGAAALNNLDFGIAGWLAGFVAIAAAAMSWPDAWRRVGGYLAGTIAAVAAYLAIGAIVTGRSFSLSTFTFYTRFYGVHEVMNVDMYTFGLQSGFAFLAMVGIVLGIVGVRRRTGGGRVLAIAIIFQSTWLGLSLIYFSGRSFTGVLTTAGMLQAGMLLVSLFILGYPQLRALARRRVRTWNRSEWTTAVLTIVALALPIASWTAFPAPSEIYKRFNFLVKDWGSTGLPDDVRFLEPDPTRAVLAARRQFEDSRLTLLTRSGSTWQLALGVRNAGVLVGPSYLSTREAQTLQCEYLATLPEDVLVTTDTIAGSLELAPACIGVLDFGQLDTLIPRIAESTYANGIEDNAGWVAIPRVDGGS